MTVTEEKKRTGIVPAKEKKDKKEEKMIAEIRQHLSFAASNVGSIPDEYIPDDYKTELKEHISRIRYYCSHNYWEDGKGPQPTPISHFFNMICKKNGGVAKLIGIISGPRLEGWTRYERQVKDMLSACFIRAVNYTTPPVKQLQWDLPKSDPRNDHPGAVNYRARKKEFEDESKRQKKNRLEAKYKKEARLKKEATERKKVKAKQRKDRKKHFAEQEKLRSGK